MHVNMTLFFFNSKQYNGDYVQMGRSTNNRYAKVTVWLNDFGNWTTYIWKLLTNTDLICTTLLRTPASIIITTRIRDNVESLLQSS